MGKSLRSIITVSFILLVLVISAVRPTGARADEVTPPPDGTPQQVDGPTEAAPTDVAPTEAPADVAATEPAPADALPEAAPNAASLLRDVPDGTSVVVVGADGQAEPLATQEAFDALVNGDPLFCPAGVSPVAGAGGCTASYTSLQALITDLNAMNTGTGPSTDGVIWIAAGYSTSSDLLPLYTPGGTGWMNYDLTFQGGWDGGAAGTISGVTTLNNATLQIPSWHEDLALNDIVFNGSQPSRGNLLVTSGNITVSNVSITNGSRDGLDAISSAGSVTLNGVTSNDNDGDGILAEGDSVSISDTTANGNLDGSGILAAGDTVSIRNTTANGNQDSDGIFVSADSDITLQDVTADGNAHNGASLLDALHISVSNGHFDNNTRSGMDVGLVIRTPGDVSLYNVSASNNRAGDGVDLYGALGEPGFPAHGPAIPSHSMTISNSVFNGNTSTTPGWGLGIYATDFDSISLTNVSASNNGNSRFAGVFLASNGSIAIDHSTFDNNAGDGLYLTSRADALVECSEIVNNSSAGIVAQLGSIRPGPVFVDGTLTTNGDVISGNNPNVQMIRGQRVDNPGFDCRRNWKPTPQDLSLAWNTIQTVSGTEQGLDCTNYAGSILILPNGNKISLPCPNGDAATLGSVTADALPGGLDEQYQFLSGIDVQVTPSLTGIMTVGFTVPAGQDPANLTILYWDGTKWVDLGGTLASDGTFAASGALTGTFVLVSK